MKYIIKFLDKNSLKYFILLSSIVVLPKCTDRITYNHINFTHKFYVDYLKYWDSGDLKRDSVLNIYVSKKLQNNIKLLTSICSGEVGVIDSDPFIGGQDCIKSQINYLKIEKIEKKPNWYKICFIYDGVENPCATQIKVDTENGKYKIVRLLYQDLEF